MTKLASLPALPSVSSVRPQHACACGCGRLTGRTFAPGHDARLKGGVVRVVRGLMTLDEIEQVMGAPFRKAVEAVLASPALLRRWSIEVPEVESEEQVG